MRRRALLLLLPAVVGTARADGDEAAAPLAALVGDLRAEDGQKRSAAARALASRGPDAVAAILDDLPPDTDWDAWEALVAALDGMGAADALAELLSLRTAWPSGRAVSLSGLEATLRDRLDVKPQRVKLLPAELPDPHLLPLALREPVLDGLPLPPAVAPGHHLVQIRGDDLVVDVRGDGKPTSRVAARKPQVLGVGGRGEERPVAFLRERDRWSCGPGGVLAGRLGRETVQVLDGDGDGVLDGPRDFVRIGDGAFVRQTADRLLMTEEGLVRYGFERDGDHWILVCRAEPQPRWADAKQLAALSWLNGWRGRTGLAPLRLDRRRSEAAALHSRYMRWNGVGHDESTDKEGYTREGSRAGRRSSVSPDPDPVATFRRISATILHRESCLGRSADGLGVGHGPGGSVLWGGNSAESEVGGPVLVPGPGQRDVDVQCLSEIPVPDFDAAFYEKMHGYPVSVNYTGALSGLSDVRLTLFVQGSETEVPGYLFTPGRPYAKSIPSNNGAAHFVAESPLLGSTRYEVVFSGMRAGVRVEVIWSFVTR